MWNRMHLGLKVLLVVLAVLGVLAIVAGVIYIALPSDSLPSFFPAHSAHSHLHADKHGYAALAIGVLLLVAAIAVPSVDRRAHSV